MKTSQRWIIKSIATLSSLSLLMAFMLFFPRMLLSGQYLAQIHISPEAASLIYNSTGHVPSMVYELNLLYYCEYNGNSSLLSHNGSNRTHFYPTPTSRTEKIKEYFSLSPALLPATASAASSQCHWASLTSQLFEIVQLFGSYSVDQVDPALPADLLLHYINLAKYSRSFPVLLMCFCLIQTYLLWVCYLKLYCAHRAITVYTLTPSYHARHMDDTFIFSCVASLLLMILLLFIDSARDQHLFQLIADFYSTEDAPIYVYPMSKGLSKLLIWMTETTILSIPISLICKYQ